LHGNQRSVVTQLVL